VGGDAALLDLPPNATVLFALNELGRIDWTTDEGRGTATRPKKNSEHK
jgi:hypothetical protein